MSRTTGALAVTAALAVLVAGCSGEDPAEPSPGASDTSGVEGSAAAPSGTGDDDADTSSQPAQPPATGGTTGAGPTGPTGSAPPGGSGGTATGSTSTRPPVGIPGGVPGAEPLTPATEQVLLALLTAEGEVGGRAYRIGPATGDGWVVTVRVFDGAREVEVSPDGGTVRSVGGSDAGPETAALENALVTAAEAAEVAVAATPGDVRSVVLVQEQDHAYWDVSVDAPDGRVRVRVDLATGERF